MKHAGKLLCFVAALILALSAAFGALAESTPSGTLPFFPSLNTMKRFSGH